MKNLLKEISFLPGVRATCIFNTQDGVVCADLDAGFPKDQTEKIARHFVRLVRMARMNRLRITSTHFRFDRFSVVFFPMEKELVLLAVCDSQANCSLVAATAAMLVEELQLEPDMPDPSTP